MLKQIRKLDNKGFTIIEIMIVLAVAALILLIVLLAVPALQRNSRNTTIKNDVSAVAGGINTFESDNNGTTPTSITGTGTVTMTASGSTTETITVNGSTSVAAATTHPPGTQGATGATPSKIFTDIGYTCWSATANSPRSVALYYGIETTSGTTWQCVAS